MSRWIALGVCALVALSLTAACHRDSNGTSATLQLDGRAELAVPGRGWVTVSDSREVGVGDSVRLVEGRGVIAMSRDRRVELKAGTQLRMGFDATANDLEPLLLAGDLLVEVPNGTLRVTTTDTDTRVGEGAARISRGLSVLVGSYTSLVALQTAGRAMNVQPLRQAAVPAAGLLPPGPSPLAYSASDPWDQRYLGETIQLGNQLVARSRGFTAQLRQGEADDPAFFRQLLPAVAQQPLDPSLDDTSRPPGERLIGLAITSVGTRATFLERWRAVTAFHDEGADWGLVALDQGVAGVPLLAEVDGALGRGPALLQETGPAGPSPSPSVTPLPPSALVSDEGSTSSGSVRAGPPPLVAAGPEPARNDGPLRTGVDLVDSTANNLVDLLSGLLSSLGR